MADSANQALFFRCSQERIRSIDVIRQTRLTLEGRSQTLHERRPRHVSPPPRVREPEIKHRSARKAPKELQPFHRENSTMRSAKSSSSPRFSTASTQDLGMAS